MRPLIGILLLLWPLSGQPALAHGLGPDVPPWQHCSFEPMAVCCLALPLVWYGLGVWRVAREVGLSRVTTAGRILAFLSGLAVMAVALLSPVDGVGDSLFWMHMVQHLLLTLVGPPLLVAGRPTVVFLWACPRPVRRRLGRLWSGVGLGKPVLALLDPRMVWLVFTANFLVWHLPGPFEFALGHEDIHELEHASFVLTGLMFWSVILAPAPRPGWNRQPIGFGARLLFLIGNGVLTGFPGALMVLAPRALYPIQALRSAEWGLSGLEDQQIAGAIMWVIGGFLYLCAGSWLFMRWLDEADRPVAATLRRAASLAPLLLLSLSLAGCDDQPAQQQMSGLLPMHGDAQHGIQVMRDIGCGNCHTIPGFSGADGVVGPSLAGIGRRVFLAGVLRNTPANMILWLRTPQAVIPGNAMPNSGLSEKDARDIAVYLASVN